MAIIIDANLSSNPAIKLVDGTQLPTTVLGSTKINRQILPSLSGQIINKDAIISRNSGATTVTDYTNLLNISLLSPYQPIWTSSDMTIATVDAGGNVSWVSNGLVDIHATVGPMNFDFPLTLSTAVLTVDTFISWVSGSLASHCTSQIDTRITHVSTFSDINLFSSIHWGDPPPSNAFVRNSSCWASNLSGITGIIIGMWDPQYDAGTGIGVTVIAPDICMTCQHAGQRNGTILYWAQTDNTLVSAIVVASQQVGLTDIRINKLDRVLPPGIAVLKFAPANLLNYLPGYSYGVPIFCINGQMNPLIYDFNYIYPFQNNNVIVSNTPTEANRLNLWQILSANNPNYSNHLGGVPPGYGTPGVYYWNFGRFISGDSGHVSALVVNNELMILGTGWTGSGGGPAGWTQLSAINAVMTNLSSAYQVTTYNLSAFPTY